MAANIDTIALLPSRRESRLSVAKGDSKAVNKPERPPFRCPLYAARGEEGSRRCKDWHNESIAAVTRHALMDAGEGTEKWRAIKDLSTAKLVPQERWRRYFVIFNDHSEDAQMNQPYWLSVEPSDTFQALASIFTDPSHSGKQALEYAMALGDLEAERRKDLELIDSEYEEREITDVAALRASLARAKARAKGQVQFTYQSQIDALKNKFAEQETPHDVGSPKLNNISITRPDDGIISVYSTGRSQRGALPTLIHNRATLAATMKDPVAEPDEGDTRDDAERSPKRKRTRVRAEDQQDWQSQRNQQFSADVLELWNDFLKGP